jgi:ubiquinone/menaquinone biosynthesis C-methylase UbiE
MASQRNITEHYSRGDLLRRLDAALADDGVDPAHPQFEDLAPYDQFHGRGIEATDEFVAMLQVAPGDHLLDIGSGIGGPARTFARRFGCRVTGIDLTAEFCEVARHLTRVMSLESQVDFEIGDAVAMRFADASFDGAYALNVSMNVADKAAFHAEIARVVKPGGWILLSEIAQGPGASLDYPTPWAADAGSSFLCTPEQTLRGLAQAGFDIVQFRETSAEAKEYGARSRAMVERGEKPPHRAVLLIQPEIAPLAMKNSARGLAEGRIVPIDVLCRKHA